MLAGFLCSFSLLASGCGPAGYVHKVTFNASSSVAAAKAVNADTYAPYEYTRAQEYLHKAREEASYADFQAANRFGKLAHKAATKAKKLAVERAANTDDKGWMPPKSLRDGSDDAKSDDAKSDDAKSDDAKGDDAKGDDAKSDDAKDGTSDSDGDAS